MLIVSMMAATSASGYEESNLMIFLMGYTVVVYLVTAQILAVVSSLLIYSVRFLCCNTILLFITGYIQIASFTVELHHNMTVYPQHYTLHCIKTGNNNNYNYSMYFGDTLVTNGIACNYSSPCNGSHLLYNSNATYDHIVNITWDAMTVSSGSFNQSVTGNHTYQCVIENGRVTRTRNIALKGN